MLRLSRELLRAVKDKSLVVWAEGMFAYHRPQRLNL